MSRVKLSEFKAKSLLVPNYAGKSLHLKSLDSDINQLDETTTYIIKVDQGIKKRGKQGLIRLNIAKTSAKQAVTELAAKGFSRFIAEPMVPHAEAEEQYLSLERVRDGIRATYSQKGGVDIEDDPESVRQYLIDQLPLPQDFVQQLIEVMNKEHFSFLEINPLVIQGESCLLLDAAVLVDSAGEYRCTWTEDDVVEATTKTQYETAVAELNQNSPAAFSFKILNPNGSLWLLLSGGGASITIADEAMNQGKANFIGNYGEYSGGPTTEETYLYTNNVLSQMFLSDAPRKALVIAGGVANFTDVKKTFGGIIQSLSEHIDQLHAHTIKVYVRRGGPNELEGLAMIREFLETNGLLGSVHGSDILLTDVINEALEYIDA